VKIWLAREFGEERYDKLLGQLLREQTALFDAVWQHTMDLLRREEESISEEHLAAHIAELCIDHVLELIPPTAEGVNRSQNRFISGVLAKHFYKEPSAQRLTLLRASAPDFTGGLQLPKARRPRPSDLLEERHKLVVALESNGSNPVHQTLKVLEAIAQIEHGPRSRGEATRDDVSQVLRRIGPVITRRILQAFRRCVGQIRYERKTVGPSKFTITKPVFEIPFRVLRDMGESFEPRKIEELICCYGYLSVAESGSYEELLDELRRRDSETWGRCIQQLLECRDTSIDWPLRYLSRIKEPFYVQRCAERLRQGLFDRINFNSLLEYLITVQPAAHDETLRSCYCLLRDRVRECEKLRKGKERPVNEVTPKPPKGESDDPFDLDVPYGANSSLCSCLWAMTTSGRGSSLLSGFATKRSPWRRMSSSAGLVFGFP